MIYSQDIKTISELIAAKDLKYNINYSYSC